MGAWKEDDPVPGHVSVQVTEENSRRFYGRWADYMAGRDWDVLMGRPATPQRAAAE